MVSIFIKSYLMILYILIYHLIFTFNVLLFDRLMNFRGYIMSDNVVHMKLDGSSKSHSRADIIARDVESVIDEPIARGGTNLGLSPTETLVSSLLGCTNVITHRIMDKMGFTINSLDIKSKTLFNKDGASLVQEVDIPFPEITLDIDISTDASENDLIEVKKQLAMYCPIGKVIRNSGTVINENWNKIN